MNNLKKAVEGVDFTINKDGTFNIRRGGRYINKGGTLYINEPVTSKPETATQSPKPESKKNEIQK